LISTQEKDGSEMSDAKKAEKKKLAEGLLKRAKAGEDFAKLAQEYSDDPGSKDRGGEYTFPRGQMVPEFEAAAFGMETNQISDLVTTQFGYHIIKLLEKHPAKAVSFEEAAPDIRKYLKTRGIQQQIPAFMAKLEKDAHVEILDPDLKQAAADRAKALAEQQADAAAKPPGAGEQKTDGQK
jgi:parvulin-like peptidyl-prolyl isomerase